MMSSRSTLCRVLVSFLKKECEQKILDKKKPGALAGLFCTNQIAPRVLTRLQAVNVNQDFVNSDRSAIAKCGSELQCFQRLLAANT